MSFTLSFCIAGAPKCGTTALVTYLSELTGVSFSSIKEPLYYANDLPALREAYGVTSRESYESLFSTSKNGDLIAEGSTLYLYSESAIAAMVNDHPNVKVVVMLRDPVQLVRSYYQQMRLHGFEDASTVSEAWALQSSRRRGDLIPTGCFEPKLLQYRAVASLGDQVDRLCRHVPEAHRLFIFHEDFVAEPLSILQRTQDFLGLGRTERTSFEQVNVGAKPRWEAFHRLLLSPPVNMVRMRAKRALPTGIVKKIAKIQRTIALRSIEKESVPAELAKQIREALYDDVRRLEMLTSRDLSHWYPS